MGDHYGWYARLFAYFMAREGRRYEAHVEERKHSLLGKLSGTVVEIGSGAGANLPYLPRDLHFVALEPNPFMHRYFKREAKRHRQSPALIRGRAETLPFRTGTVDAVISTLVLCSVRDVGQALGEIRRVLKDGGRFVFVEHVAAPPDSLLLRAQRAIRPIWRRLGDGCEPDRFLEGDLKGAGFRDIELTEFRLPLPIVGPHLMGVAFK